MTNPMRLGRDTGSLVNHVLSAGSPVMPAIGMGATILSWTDRHAGTVVGILTRRDGSLLGVRVQEDTATRVDRNGMSEAQAYDYTPNPEGHVWTFRRHNGAWRECHANGRVMAKGSGMGLALGRRERYYDFSF